jgi:hypothetical protein
MQGSIIIVRQAAEIVASSSLLRDLTILEIHLVPNILIQSDLFFRSPISILLLGDLVCPSYIQLLVKVS